jgi:hypothetical protein
MPELSVVKALAPQIPPSFKAKPRFEPRIWILTGGLTGWPGWRLIAGAGGNRREAPKKLSGVVRMFRKWQ